MNNKKTLLILTLILVVLLVGAIVLYNKLQEAPGTTAEDIVAEELSSETPEKETPPEDRNPAPDFTVYDTQGNKVSFSDFKGKPVIINFWATWCGPCQSEMPHFEDAYNKYGDDIHFLMINLTDGMRETPETVQDFLNHFGYTSPVYYDIGYNASNAYGISPIPATFFIDKNGNIASSQIGAMTAAMLEKHIELIK